MMRVFKDLDEHIARIYLVATIKGILRDSNISDIPPQ
jgi:hypothetical protein